MLRPWLFALASTFWLAACTAQPDDPLFIKGQALDPDGQPIADGGIVVGQFGVDPYVGDGGVYIANFHLLTDSQQRSRTDGRFVITLLQRDLPRAIFVVVGMPGTFDSAGPSFQVQPYELSLPPHPAWRPRGRAVLGERGTEVAFAQPPHVQNPTSVGRGVALYWSVIHQGADTVWLTRQTLTTAFIPDEVLEDFVAPELSLHSEEEGTTSLTVSADLNQLGGMGGNVYTLIYDAPPLALESRGRVPISRGAVCEGLLPLQAPCALTDGKLAPVELSSSATLGWLQIQLSRPALLRRMLLRHSSANLVLRVEGSNDGGATWHTLASIDARVSRPTDSKQGPYDSERVDVRIPSGSAEQFLDIPLDAALGPVSRIRLRPAPGAESTPREEWQFVLSELSLFE